MASSMSDDIANGFTEKQLDRLNKLFDTFLAPASALPPALSELLSALPSDIPHLQSTSAPIHAPIPTRSYPPSPSVETIEEVKYKQICKIQMRKKKHGASKKTRTSRSASAEICIGWPTKSGGSNMRRSRDEDLDAWYTTMLNYTQKLAI